MKINLTGLIVLLVVVAGMVVGAYMLGSSQQAVQTTAAPAPVAQAPATTTPAAPATPLPEIPAHNIPLLSAPAPSAVADQRKKYTHFRVGNRNVKSIHIEGNVAWVGTSGGVVRYDISTDDYKLYNNTNGLLSNGVFYVGKVRGKIAVGTYGGGLSLFDEKTGSWSNYNIPNGLADAFVYEVLQAANGDIWIATWSGANRILGGDLDDRSKWVTYTVENTNGGLPNDWVYGLDEDSDGTIWLGTEGGLARFKDEQWLNWQHKDGLGAQYEVVKADIQFKSDPGQASKHHARQKVEQGLEGVDIAYNPNYIISMEVDHKNRVWSGTWGGGLSRYDGKAWTTFTMKNGLPSNHIFMLHEDADGRLWVGTSGGLALYDEAGNGFRIFTTAHGLFSDNVFSMAEAADGSLWIGSYGGVARVASLP